MSQAKTSPADRDGAGQWRSRRSQPPGCADPGSSHRLGNYLRQLREGYGYTLRKVEQQSQALGEPIDNSQLSRFEKGKAVPSFEKLRALARIFNVTVQNFSDVLDLEEFSAYRPQGADYEALMRSGDDAFSRGDHGKAFVIYERALEIADESGVPARTAAERSVAARWRMASALKALGKLSLAEVELRNIFKDRQHLGRRTHLRCLLELSHVNRQLGDLYIATLLCKECLELAVEDSDVETQARVLNNLGSIHHDEGEHEQALGYFERSHELFAELGFQKMRLTVLTNLGGCLVTVRRFDEGVARLREAYSEARTRGYRRVAALAANRLGEAFYARGDHAAARRQLTESDALASVGERYDDILFGNAYLRWQMARHEHNRTGETVAFGQLKRLRSRIERTFPEVLEFDTFVETARRHYV